MRKQLLVWIFFVSDLRTCTSSCPEITFAVHIVLRLPQESVQPLSLYPVSFHVCQPHHDVFLCMSVVNEHSAGKMKINRFKSLQRLYDYCTAGVGSYSDSMIIVRQVSAATDALWLLYGRCRQLQMLYDYCTAGVGSYRCSMSIVRQVSAATDAL